MLKKENRLSVFRLKNPKQINNKYFNVKIAENKENALRFGFVVSKRLDKRAVIRNRVKRKIRSCVEEVVGDFSIGHDFLFYPKTESIDAQRTEILEEVKKIIK